eukprot:522866_1
MFTWSRQGFKFVTKALRVEAKWSTAFAIGAAMPAATAAWHYNNRITVNNCLKFVDRDERDDPLRVSRTSYQKIKKKWFSNKNINDNADVGVIINIGYSRKGKSLNATMQSIALSKNEECYFEVGDDGNDCTLGIDMSDPLEYNQKKYEKEAEDLETGNIKYWVIFDLEGEKGEKLRDIDQDFILTRELMNNIPSFIIVHACRNYFEDQDFALLERLYSTYGIDMNNCGNYIIALRDPDDNAEFRDEVITAKSKYNAKLVMLEQLQKKTAVQKIKNQENPIREMTKEQKASFEKLAETITRTKGLNGVKRSDLMTMVQVVKNKLSAQNKQKMKDLKRLKQEIQTQKKLVADQRSVIIEQEKQIQEQTVS